MESIELLYLILDSMYYFTINNSNLFQVQYTSQDGGYGYWESLYSWVIQTDVSGP
jgi:hypothetical protein